MRSGNKVAVEPHKHEAVFIAKGEEDALATKKMAPGATVYIEKKIYVQANCIDSTVPTEAVFQSEMKKMVQEQLKPSEQVTLEPFVRDRACVVGGYCMPKKQSCCLGR